MAAGNCLGKFNWGQRPHIWVNGRSHAPFYHAVIYRVIYPDIRIYPATLDPTTVTTID